MRFFLDTPEKICDCECGAAETVAGGKANCIAAGCHNIMIAAGGECGDKKKKQFNLNACATILKSFKEALQRAKKS